MGNQSAQNSGRGVRVTPIADLVARLIAAGTPPELAAVVVTEAFAAGASCGKSGGIPVDETAERRRAYDRERKRKAKDSGGIPVEIPRNSETPLTSSSSPQSENSQKEENKKERAAKKGGTLPVEWQPSQVHFEQGADLRLKLDEINGMAADMRLWAGANANRAVARKSNWDLAFSAWMRREAGKRKPTNVRSGILDAADRAIESLKQREAADSGASVGGPQAFRLIS